MDAEGTGLWKLHDLKPLCQRVGIFNSATGSAAGLGPAHFARPGPVAIYEACTDTQVPTNRTLKPLALASGIQEIPRYMLVCPTP